MRKKIKRKDLKHGAGKMWNDKTFWWKYLGSVHILCNHRGAGGSLKCLSMIMREGEGGWP